MSEQGDAGDAAGADERVEDTGVAFDPAGDDDDGHPESSTDHDADDADALLPGEGDDAGLHDISTDDI